MIATAKSLGYEHSRTHRKYSAGAAGPADRPPAGHPDRGQGGVGESGRLGEGPRGVLDCAGRAAPGTAEVGTRTAGCDQRQYRHCLRHAGRGDAVSGDAVHAVECLAGAQAVPAAYGANIVWTNPADGSDGAIRKAREMAAAEPDRYYYADQYSNDENWKAHYRTTANEIWEQTEGQVTHFVAALGTSGTFMGTTRRLKELNPKIQCISMQPDSPFNGLEGLKHMATAIVPAIYDPNLADRNIEMATERAYKMAKFLGREQGVLVGVSAAAATAAALQVAEEVAARGQEAVIVTILCDGADKYMSERFWQEEE